MKAKYKAKRHMIYWTFISTGETPYITSLLPALLETYTDIPIPFNLRALAMIASW